MRDDTRPRARREGLLVEQLGDELVIYDTARKRAHCLNPSAVLVWRMCDGKSTTSHLAARLARDSGLPEDRAIVEDALNQLRANCLLEPDLERAVPSADTTRRELLKRLGVLAATLPLVQSISAPTPAMAQSPPPPPPPPLPTSGCTPGYWKNHDFPSPYTENQLFKDAGFADAFPGLTLQQVLELGGGGLNALGRHAVAALLNAQSLSSGYGLTVQQVIDQFNAAFAAGTDEAYEAQKDSFEALTDDFEGIICPLN